jgi:hypothetical protein
MKYKVGDKVRVRTDLVVDKVYGGLDCLQVHKKECGKIFTIKDSDGYDYHLNGSDFWWSEEMLEDVDENKKEDITILVKDNKVIAKKGNKVGIAKCSPEDEFDIFTGVRLAIDRLEKKCKPYSWLKEGVMYYFPNVLKDNLYDYYHYDNDATDKVMISRGLVFKTKEEAINCAKKMLEVVK